MARECIYCGRKLKTGEVCNCRRGGQAGPTTGTGAGAAGGSKRTPRGDRTRSPRGPSRARPGTRRQTSRSPRWIDTLRTLLRQYAGFLRTPVDTAITLAVQPGYEAMVLLVGLEAVAAAIVAAIGYGAPRFYVNFVSLGLSLSGATSAGTAALLAAIQTFVRWALLTGILHLYLRFLARVRVGLRELAAAIAPASAPLTVAMLIAAFSARSAAPLSTLTLLLGLLTGAILTFFTVRRRIRRDDNQTLVILVLGYLLYFGALSLVVGSWGVAA